MNATKPFVLCLFACLVTLSLAACGGGGGTGDGAVDRVRALAQASFIHQATAGNTSAHLTYLDHPYANDNPGAVLIVTQNWNPYDTHGTWNNHPVGAHYDSSRSRWAVMNVDRATMPVDAAFNVTVSTAPAAGPSVFIRHRVTWGSVDSHMSWLDHTSLNGNPDALLFVTPYHDPGGEGTALNPRSVSVLFNTAADRWCIFNQDNAPMPVDAAYSLAVTGVGGSHPFDNAMVHTASAANTEFNYTYCDITLDRNAILHTMHVFGPGGAPFGVRNNRAIGVWFNETAGRWGVFNEDAEDMSVLTSYSVGLAD